MASNTRVFPEQTPYKDSYNGLLVLGIALNNIVATFQEIANVLVKPAGVNSSTQCY